MKKLRAKDQPAVCNVNENPCNMCMPMGAILPFKGIEQSMVMIHGSQGCSTYMRRHIAEHFNEPIDVGSSSLNEKGTIYGGENNLKQGLDNIVKVYQPKLIGVLTTCLAETIGEDIERISEEYLQEREHTGLKIIPVPTPGYGDSHSEGYWLATFQIVKALAQETTNHNKINVIVPNISPADIREIKRMLDRVGVQYTLFPDFSDTLDRPLEKTYKKIPDGGTGIADLAGMPGAPATIQFGYTVGEQYSPGHYLAKEFGVPLYNLPIPIGLKNTDQFMAALTEITQQPVPVMLEQERGRLMDAMVDSHKYNFAGRSVIFGDPELVYAITTACVENGIFPEVVATGSTWRKLQEALEPSLKQWNLQPELLIGSDFVQIREHARNRQANVAIGHSDGRYLTEREGIPLVRMGFPIHDRVGGQRILSVGYVGTAMFLDRITNTLLESKLSNYRQNMYKQYYESAHPEDGSTLEC